MTTNEGIFLLIGISCVFWGFIFWIAHESERKDD